jgi:hypothetical protein
MKWLLIVVAVLVLIVGAVALIGYTLPQNHTASRSAEFSPAPDSVWAIVTDVARYPSWRKDVESVEIIPGQALSWREIVGRGRMTYEATVFEKPSHFVSHIADKGLPFGGSWDYRIEPSGTGSKLTITENGEVYNPIFRFVSRFVMGHATTIDKYLAALAVRTGDTYRPAD